MSIMSSEAQYNRPRETGPTLAAIAHYWSQSLGRFQSTFPYGRPLEIGWGEPCCFRCGWLAPVKESSDYPAEWKPERRMRAAWNAAAGWLERAHLHDHLYGGDMLAENIVPLCPLCHLEQLPSRTREDGIAFVNSCPTIRHALQSMVQMYTDDKYTDHDRPSSSKDATRLLQKAYAEVGQVYAYISLGRITWPQR